MISIVNSQTLEKLYDETSNNILYPRTESSQFCKDIFDELYRENSTIKSVLNFLFDSFLNLIKQNVPIDDLIRDIKLENDYRLQSYCMNVYYRHLTMNGMNLQPDDILPYINVLKTHGEISKIGESMRHPDLWKQSEHKEIINVLIYIKELESNNFDEAFVDRFDSDILPLITYNRKYKKVRKTQHTLMNPVKLIIDIYEDNFNILPEDEFNSYLIGCIQCLLGYIEYA